jgi:hypothetical protein
MLFMICFILITAQKYSAQLFAYDKKLAKISAEMNIEVISYQPVRNG